MDKIKMTKKEFDELYEVEDTKDLPGTTAVDKPETVLNDEEQAHDDRLMEDYQ